MFIKSSHNPGKMANNPHRGTTPRLKTTEIGSPKEDSTYGMLGDRVVYCFSNKYYLKNIVQLLQPLRWCCVDCVIHRKRDVREE